MESIPLVVSESAVVPLTAPPQQPEPNFDLMALLNDTIDEVDDQELVMAVTQYEASLAPNVQNIVTTTSNTAIMKKTTPVAMLHSATAPLETLPTST